MVLPATSTAPVGLGEKSQVPGQPWALSNPGMPLPPEIPHKDDIVCVGRGDVRTQALQTNESSWNSDHGAALPPGLESGQLVWLGAVTMVTMGARAMGELGVEKWGSWGRKEPQIAPVGSPGPSAWTGRPAAPSFLEQGRQDLSHLWLGDPCRASGLGTQWLEAREWT